MSKPRRIVLAGLLLLVLLWLVAWHVLMPRFWIVALVSGVALLVFHLVALSDWKYRDLVFVLTDWFHYAVVGGVVVLGAQYIRGADLVSRLDRHLELVAAQEQVARSDRELPVAQEKLRRLEEHPLDRQVLDACYAEAGRLTIAPHERSRGAEPRKPPTMCESILARERDAVLLGMQISTQQKQREDAVMRIAALRAPRPPGPVEPDVRTLEVLFVLFPTIILIGVSAKLGKTTAAFISFRARREIAGGP